MGAGFFSRTALNMENRAKRPCPLCHGSKVQKRFPAQEPFSKYSLVQCSGCALGYTFPFPEDKPSSSGLFKSYYGTGPNKFAPLLQGIRTRLMRMRAKRYLQLISKSVQQPKILDVGCAEGRLLKVFLDYDCKCWGIEHHSYPSHRFMEPERITYLKGGPEASHLPGRSFDLIFLWHTLEHMDDPNGIIHQIGGLLAPSGAIILAVPNISSMEAQRFKEFWFHVDIPWHRYHFNEESIRYLLAKHNLRITDIRSFCLEQGPYGLLQSILNAMGLPRNEFYEFLKGRRDYSRSLHIIFQMFLAATLLIPALMASFMTSLEKKGSVLKMIIRKEDGDTRGP